MLRRQQRCGPHTCIVLVKSKLVEHIPATKYAGRRACVEPLSTPPLSAPGLLNTLVRATRPAHPIAR
ncbi:hypothetical protein C8Q76DRAFT_731735 [Earliella scabrosa]|nr:hypothetical protein C8Q76DRAFT_731735 [Earliella scabrosa]